MTAQIVRSRQAARDSDEIWDWMAEHSPDLADKAVRRIDQAIRLLAVTPLMGRERLELSSGLRSIVCGKHVIFYRFDELANQVAIIRVIHQRRDLPDLLSLA